ncbi:MAG: ABC transporter substrate-binding protein, partial [Solirubrobacterales bacterium]
MTTTIHLATFSGASSLPLFVAIEMGHFAAHGLEVELTKVKNSDQLMTGLLDGSFEIAHSAPDNFIAWRDRTSTDIVAWIGGAGGPLELVAAPGIDRLDGLRGRTIAVDSPESGFVSTLRLILRAGGLAEDDVTLEALGSTQLRYQALLAGKTSATMLTLPWSLLAVEAGCSVVGDQASVLPRLQGSCGASLATWLRANPEIADAYLRALVAALTDLYTGSLPEADVRRMLSDRYGIEERHVEVIRRAFVDPVVGWPPSG